MEQAVFLTGGCWSSLFLNFFYSFCQVGSLTRPLTYLLIHTIRTQCRPAYYNIWGWLFLVTTVNYQKGTKVQSCNSTARQDRTIIVLLSGICCCATVMIQFKGHSIDFIHPLLLRLLRLLLLSLWNVYNVFFGSGGSDLFTKFTRQRRSKKLLELHSGLICTWE